MKPNPKTLMPVMEQPNEPEMNMLITGDHFLPSCNKIMRDCVDYVLYRTSANRESANEVMLYLNSYLRNIKTNNFFLMANIKNTITEVQNNPSLFYYFKTLDHMFILNIQSHFERNYKEIINTFTNLLKNSLPESREHSVLNDDNFMNNNIDIENIESVLANNSIIFTIYCFSVAFPFTAAFNIS